jgi:hypothetical protein
MVSREFGLKAATPQSIDGSGYKAQPQTTRYATPAQTRITSTDVRMRQREVNRSQARLRDQSI